MKKKLRIKSYFRKGKKVRGHTKIITIGKQTRRIFNHISDPKQHNREYGGAIDFNKKGKLERFDVTPGSEYSVYLPDYEVLYHTHPRKSIDLPSPEDIITLLRNNNQQVEMVFSNGESYVINKTKKSKWLEGKSNKQLMSILEPIYNKAQEKRDMKYMERELDRLGFHSDFSKKKNKPIHIRIEPVE